MPDSLSLDGPWTVRRTARRRRRQAGVDSRIAATLRVYRSFAGRYRQRVAIAAIIMPVIILAQNGLLPLTYSKIIDQLHRTNGHIQHLSLWLAGFLGLHLVVFTGQRLGALYWSRLEHDVIKDVEQHIFAHLLKQSNHFHTSNHAGGLVAQAKRFTGAFSSLANAAYHNLYALLVRILVAFGFLMFLAPFIGLVLLLWTAIYMISIFWLTKRKMHASAAAAAADSTMTAHLSDAISNAPTIKMFGSERIESQAYAGLSRDKHAKRRRDWLLSEMIMGWQSLLMILLEAVVLTMSISLVQHGVFTVGKLALVQFFLAPILASLWTIASIFRQVEAALSDAAEMTATLAVRPSVKDPANPQPVRIRDGGIEFRYVDFGYGTGRDKRTIFDNFNLLILPGQKVGLVGPSGSGKSSLTKLLSRFMDVDSGAIEIDGQDISAIRQAELRKHIAFVPQEPQLFHRTIKENIRYSKPDATDEEIVKAAKQARAHGFIMKLPEGYNTLVGERGSKLSGGERQRVAIARAMLKDAPIVVLDEATSALDSESEKLVQAAFDKLMEGRTAIVIAHRLSTVQHMDRIIVLKDGQVVEDGPHWLLMSQDDVYAGLWRHQSGVVSH